MWDEAADIEQIEHQENDASALVVIVPSLSDWEHVTEDHWYRIPAKHTPAQTQVEYLAFYHPRIFDEWRFSVRYMARVRHIRVISRADLIPDEPNHPRANELYYRYDLDEIEQLPHIIKSKNLRRVTFIPTKLSLLLASQEILQLWDRETTIDRLRQALEIREISCTKDYAIQSVPEGFAVDLAIPCSTGGVGVLCRTTSRIPQQQPLDWDILVFTPERIQNDVESCARAVAMLVIHKSERLTPGPQLPD